MSNHDITREIGIDMGHRVTHHGSKCRNLHGHRYTIQATCSGPLFAEGEQQGMVLDFGFLKDIMMEKIDLFCDHGVCLWVKDPWVPVLLDNSGSMMLAIEKSVAKNGFYFKEHIDSQNLGGKFYIVPFVPTAENLARHWFNRMKGEVLNRSKYSACLTSVKVFETPNCSAQYPGDEK